MYVALRIVQNFPFILNPIIFRNYVQPVSQFSVSYPNRNKNQRLRHFKYYISPAIEEEANVQDRIEEEREMEVSSKQNKSGLSSFHYRIEHKVMPSLTEDELEIAQLWKYRKYFGKYGKSSNIDLKALWPSTSELHLLKEKERMEFPHTVQEMINMAKEERLKEEQEIMDRQEELKQKEKNLEKWMKDLKTRVNKKETEAKRILEVKLKQIEDVREMLGYNISPQDPKFKEILEKKVEEDKKRAKKERKLRRQQLELEQLTEAAKKEAMEAQASHSESNVKEQNLNKE